MNARMCFSATCPSRPGVGGEGGGDNPLVFFSVALQTKAQRLPSQKQPHLQQLMFQPGGSRNWWFLRPKRGLAQLSCQERGTHSCGLHRQSLRFEACVFLIFWIRPPLRFPVGSFAEQSKGTEPDKTRGWQSSSAWPLLHRTNLAT